MLCSTEKLTMGGVSSVRGFKEDSIASDNGVFIRNELILDLLSPSQSQTTTLLTSPEIFLAYDFGSFRQSEEQNLIKGRISSIATGLRNTSGSLKLDLTLATQLSSNISSSKTNTEFYLSCQMEV